MQTFCGGPFRRCKFSTGHSPILLESLRSPYPYKCLHKRLRQDPQPDRGTPYRYRVTVSTVLKTFIFKGVLGNKSRAFEVFTQYCLFLPPVLGFKLMTLHLLDRCSIYWATPSDLFALVIFWIRSWIYGWAGLNYNSISAPLVAGMTGTQHHTQLLLVEMGSC
jgi:hypothetical protein